MRCRGEEKRKNRRKNKNYDTYRSKALMRKRKERRRGNLTAVSRRTAAALCVGGVGARMQAAAVLCAVACGIACVLGAGEEEDDKEKSECGGEDRCPLPAIYGRFGEIVGA